MSQHLIDLMPEDLRLQSQAGVRKGQTFIAYAITGALLVGLITHSTIERNGQRKALELATIQANQVLKLERQRKEIAVLMNADRQESDRYDRIALPVPVASVLASVINQLPQSVVLDAIELDAGSRKRSRSARNARRDNDDEAAAPRRLAGELAGFAANDDDIAELVDRLNHLPPLADANIDYTRTRVVRGRMAREFRLSFTIDLEVNYQVTQMQAAATGDRP